MIKTHFPEAKISPFFLLSGILLVLHCHGATETTQPLQDWSFNRNSVSAKTITDKKSGLRGIPETSTRLTSFGLFLDGETSIDVPDVTKDRLPVRDISVEAWVSLDRGIRWGSILGYYQDNGSYEKGWLLGYNERNFLFSVSTASKLHSVTSSTAFEKGKWYHVVGAYDGKTMELYVNGAREAAGAAASGDIAYPDKAFYTIGAYRDQDEFFRMQGTIHSARLYGTALSSKEVSKRHDEGKAMFPSGLAFDVKPHLRFDSPRSATVYWESGETGETILTYGRDEDLNLRVKSENSGPVHSVTIDDLEPGEVHNYRITATNESGVRKTSDVYELDMRMNFSTPPTPRTSSETSREFAEIAGSILELSGVNRGICVVYGFGSGELAYELAMRSDLIVFGFDDDRKNVVEARKRLYERGVYGSRVSVRHVPSLDSLPVTGNLANLLVSESMLISGKPIGRAAEIQRLLRPEGGAALLRKPGNEDDGKSLAKWLEVDAVPYAEVGDGNWIKIAPGPSPESGEWTHQYGNAANTTTSGEKLGGATATTDLEVQWIGRPGADFGIDRNPRMPAPLSAGGRLFHQGMNRMIALDAYNGAVQWSLEIPDLRRVNMPRDASNWCTDGNELYVVVKDRCWVIDAATGHRNHACRLPGPYAPDTHDWGYVAQDGELYYGSAVKKGSSYTAFWGGSMWYDKNTPQSAAKVCSEGLFGVDKVNHQLVWTYRDGVILNSAIAIRDDKIFFVESRNAEAMKRTTGRLHGPSLWKDQFLVALDSSSGTKLWERPIDTADGTIVFYLLATEHGIVIQSSTNGKFHLYNHDLDTGSLQWEIKNNWPSADHSGHMQHPVAINGRLFLEPSAFDLKTGKMVISQIGKRSGCHTYVGTKDALIYRGAGRQIAVWGQESRKTSTWNRLRPSCWISVVPAAGMLLVPEGGGGCSCGGWMETSLAFRPRNASGPTKDDK